MKQNIAVKIFLCISLLANFSYSMHNHQNCQTTKPSFLNEHLFERYLYLAAAEIPVCLRWYMLKSCLNVYIKIYIDKINESSNSCEMKLFDLLEFIPHLMAENKQFMPNGRPVLHELADFEAKQIAQTITVILAQSVQDINRCDFEIMYEEYDDNAKPKKNLILDYRTLVNNTTTYFELLLRNDINKYFEKCLDILTEFYALRNYQGVQIITYALALVDDLIPPHMKEKTPAWNPDKHYSIERKQAGFLNYNKYFQSYSAKRSFGKNREAEKVIKTFLRRKKAVYRYKLEINDNFFKTFKGNTNLCFECVRNIKNISEENTQYNLASKTNFAELGSDEIYKFLSDQKKLEIWEWLSHLGALEGKCIAALLTKIVD